MVRSNNSSSIIHSSTTSPTSVATTHSGSKRVRLAAPASRPVVRLEDFYQSPVPHPYGVLPGGNRFLLLVPPNTQEDASPTAASKSSNRTLAQDLLLTEECWNSVLSFLDGPDLGRLAQTCRFWYVAAHQPEFWRDLVLQQSRRPVIDRMGPSWKDTYVLLEHETWYNSGQDQQDPASGRPHQPMAVPGIYSDYYYRLHSCRSFTLPKVWSKGSDDGCPWTVPKIPFDEMTSERFVRDYERPNRPVVIQGAALHWAAGRQWTNPLFDPGATTTTTFRATSGVASQPAQFTWRAYQQYCHFSSPLEEGPLYLFDRTALQPGSALWHDYTTDLQRTCPYWNPDATMNDTTAVVYHDLLQVLGEGRRPDHTWLIAGPPRSGSVFHLDPNATHAWNATIQGRKRWIFYPPGLDHPPPGVHPSPDGDQVALPWTVGEWILQFWPEHCQRKHAADAPPQSRPLEVTSLPGDVVFVPHGWWHMVVNLENDDDDNDNDGGGNKMNIAITHNYVSASNLGNVLKFLDRHRDQVSGCRDRPESIKPETLYEEFVVVLQQRHPQLLAAALAEPDWTCPAWNKMTAQAIQSDQPASNGENENANKEKEEPPLSVMDKAKSGGNLFSFSFV